MRWKYAHEHHRRQDKAGKYDPIGAACFDPALEGISSHYTRPRRKARQKPKENRAYWGPIEAKAKAEFEASNAALAQGVFGVLSSVFVIILGYRFKLKDFDVEDFAKANGIPMDQASGLFTRLRRQAQECWRLTRESIKRYETRPVLVANRRKRSHRVFESRLIFSLYLQPETPIDWRRVRSPFVVSPVLVRHQQ